MIGALLVGFFIGCISTMVSIIVRWFTGTPTLVSANGWAMGPLKWGGWGILIGAIIAAFEVMGGTKLRESWGLTIVLSSIGSMVAGVVTWKVWTLISNPATPPAVEEKKS